LKAAVDAQIRNNTHDVYVTSLLSIALYNLRRPTEAIIYSNALQRLQFINGSMNSSRIAYTVSNAGGAARLVEATAFAVLAWNFNRVTYARNIENATLFIVSRNQEGSFGPGQVSVFALNATLGFIRTNNGFGGNGNFSLRFNNKTVAILPFRDTNANTISFDFMKIFNDANNSYLFQKDTVLNVSLTLENFTLTNKLVDFRVMFVAAHRYVDNN
jgi:hypothetical protein